jgi:tetratricopeptide (TPR) repeat protein
VGTWETTFAGTINGCFSPDGAVFATQSSQGLLRLLEPATGRELTRLDDQSQARGWLAFTPDGGRLIASSEGGKVVHVWDLRTIRAQLAALGLDWDIPAYAPAEPAARGPLHITVHPGSGYVDPHVRHALASLRLALNRFDFEAYGQRGQALGRLRRHQEAVADYSLALALMPAAHKDRGELLLRRCSNYGHLNDRAHAEADLQELARADLAVPEPLRHDAAAQCNNLAWRYVAGPEAERDPARALPLIRKALELTPGDWGLFNTQGVVSYRLGEYSQAVAWLERSLRDSGGATAAYDLYFLAMCHARRREATEARNCYDQAIRWVQESGSSLPQGWAEELTAFQKEAEATLKASLTDSDSIDVKASPRE